MLQPMAVQMLSLFNNKLYRVPGSVPLPQSRGIYSQSAKSWPCKIDPLKLQAYLDGFERYESNM